MATTLGARAERLTAVRSLHAVKGRRLAGRFAFEGATLLEEARSSGYPIEEIYATEAAYEAAGAVRELEREGVPVFLVGERAAAKISDLDSPAGLVAVAPARLADPQRLFSDDGTVLILADLNDPGNAGTLLRCAAAFGCPGVVFGRLGVDPYHPKVVRAAMGAIFRVPIAVADPPTVARAAAAAGVDIAGLAIGGDDLRAAVWPARNAIAVGNERHGLGSWSQACKRFFAIPMPGRAESLNAAIAGSIALYEAVRARA